uniref:SAM domain-containing protein n=1 Tax=Echinococcus canadensis TaxID=519352 RepID=A0A915ETK8_9CEST
MYGSHFKLPSEGDVAPENGLRRSINTLSVFISPNSRGQTYVYQTQATTKETRGTSFDEIENLRTEVKRLSDIVSKQSDLISCIQKALSEKPNEDKSVDKLDLQTEFNQHKIALSCLERDNMAMESMIKRLEGEVASLTVTVGHQCNELLLLRNAVRDLYLGAGGEAQSERSSTSPQMRSVSCSELQANCVSHSVSEGNEQRGRVVRSYTSQFSSEDVRTNHNARAPSLLLNLDWSTARWQLGTGSEVALMLSMPTTLSSSRSGEAISIPLIESRSVETTSPEETPDPRQLTHNTRHDGNTRNRIPAWHFTSSGFRRFHYSSAFGRRQWFLPLHSLIKTQQFVLSCPWLDDIGLPMYKPRFEAELIDAYLLHELTLSELQTLGVNSELHMVSLRRGLQLMRQLNFDLTRLCRRPISTSCSALPRSCNNGTTDDLSQRSLEVPAFMMESAHSTPALRLAQPPTLKSPLSARRSTSVSLDTVCRENTLSQDPTSTCRSPSLSSSLPPPSSLALWTLHRVEAWLCEIELPEYASGLRSSGLHGALLLYEDRFTVETLAALLDIGPERTLLRRHLSEEFANLLDSSLCHRKQCSTDDTTTTVPALNPSTKLKVNWLELLPSFAIRHMNMKIALLQGYRESLIFIAASFATPPVVNNLHQPLGMLVGKRIQMQSGDVYSMVTGYSIALITSKHAQLIERRSSLRRIFDVTGGGNAGGVRYLGSDLLCPLETDFNFKNSSL